MPIGLSTYAFFWRWSAAGTSSLSLHEMLRATSELDVRLLQICDYPAIQSMSAAQLRQVRSQAEDLGMSLELGTRGTTSDHLEHYLEIAKAVGASFVRTMLMALDAEPGRDQQVQSLRSVLPAYADEGVTLGLETYEQVSIDDLVAVVEAVGTPGLGICLDPGNCVARLEYPDRVIRARCAARREHAYQRLQVRTASRVGRVFAHWLPFGHRTARLRPHGTHGRAGSSGYQPDRRTMGATGRVN